MSEPDQRGASAPATIKPEGTLDVRIDFGQLGWRSLFHRDCPKSPFGGVVGPDGPRDDDSSWHSLPDGSEIRAYWCFHCEVRFYAGTDKQHRVIVVPRPSQVAP